MSWPIGCSRPRPKRWISASESEATKKLYGMDDPATASYGTNLLLARRLVERGVRFVECYSGSGSRWDAHASLEANHTENCKSSDKPVAGLLADLKARGMLKDTLVVWGGEFGRTPFVQGSPNDEKAGRDHNPWGFTMWMAGGGVKGGQAIGTTDEIGLRAVEEPHHVHDIHASILYLLGLDHLRTTYMHNGRAERPTGTAGSLDPKSCGRKVLALPAVLVGMQCVRSSTARCPWQRNICDGVQHVPLARCRDRQTGQQAMVAIEGDRDAAGVHRYSGLGRRHHRRLSREEFPDRQNQREQSVGERSGDRPRVDRQGIGSDCPVPRKPKAISKHWTI